MPVLNIDSIEEATSHPVHEPCQYSTCTCTSCNESFLEESENNTATCMHSGDKLIYLISFLHSPADMPWMMPLALLSCSSTALSYWSESETREDEKDTTLTSCQAIHHTSSQRHDHNETFQHHTDHLDGQLIRANHAYATSCEWTHNQQSAPYVMSPGPATHSKSITCTSS